PIVFSTAYQNIVKLRYKNEVPFVINEVQKHDYVVRLYGEFWLGVGFLIAEAVFAFVPDGYDPQASLKPSNQFPDGTTPDVENPEEDPETDPEEDPETDPEGSAGGGI